MRTTRVVALRSASGQAVVGPFEAGGTVRVPNRVGRFHEDAYALDPRKLAVRGRRCRRSGGARQGQTREAEGLGDDERRGGGAEALRPGERLPRRRGEPYQGRADPRRAGADEEGRADRQRGAQEPERVDRLGDEASRSREEDGGDDRDRRARVAPEGSAAGLAQDQDDEDGGARDV